MESTRRRHGRGPGQRKNQGNGRSVQHSFASSPPTPANKSAGDADTKFDVWFLEFCDHYSLDLRRPNPEQTGSSSYPYDDDSWFYSRLKDCYVKERHDVVCNFFLKAARDVHVKWVRKPRGERDVTPSLTGDLPRPSTESERAELLNCLAETLETLTGESRPPTRHTKRPSPEEESDGARSSKRSRRTGNHSGRPPSVLSRLDSGEVRALTPVPEPAVSLVLYSQQSNAASANTSRSSLASRVFSEPEDHAAYPTTQETEVTVIAASSQEKSLPIAVSKTIKFKERLGKVWPTLPASLERAPLAVRWEVTRVALHCGVSLDDLDFQYSPILNDQAKLWEQLRRLSAFEGKAFPEISKREAWNAAMSDDFSSTDQVVVLTVSLTLNTAKQGPLFKVSLQPLRLDLPYRLSRRFGSDRFLELILPSPYTREVKALSKGDESVIIDSIHSWLVRDCHVLMGREWKSFFVKQATPKKLHKDDTLRPETITILQERAYLFAEDGVDFLRRATNTQSVSPRNEPQHAHTIMTRAHLLDWLLQIQQNKQQSVYKLFSRIALGLSRTRPTAVVQPHQIRHQDTDIISPANKVMNDGIGRMSTALVRQIRDIMGLDDLPAGFQGRFGCAKGFWIRDTEDTSDEIWIETYPSQRKWICDFQEEDHRTFEVRSASKELRSATLNLQLLPILEDRAINSSDMKKQVGKFMEDSLASEMASQKEAMKNPAHFKLWVHENATGQRRQDRVRLGHLPWTAGLPTSREDQMELLLSQGFDPTKLEFLRKIAYGLREEKCKELQTRLNVKVGRSTYAYMVVDFSSVLEEDEVHLGFSSKFTDEQSGFSETFLHGTDVLVARTPAHYPSDIQRVKAVFKPELGSLKDVIVFSTKGKIPLADKLSGGDYDGDIAWVCWEPKIVNNFTNAPLPDVPDLFKIGVLEKKATPYEVLAQSYEDATVEFLDQAFRFNMEPNLLGTCTNYKEKLCYSRNSVQDEPAIFMSTLISNLVDRAKQGILFSEKDWDRQRNILNTKQGDALRARKKVDPPQPEYKKDNYGRDGAPTHIIDYVKFNIGKPTVERELQNLNLYLSKAEHFDGDLVKYVESFEISKPSHEARKAREKSSISRKRTFEIILERLKQDIEAVHAEWSSSRDDFEARVSNAFDKWRGIAPAEQLDKSTKVKSLCEKNLAGVGLSPWDLLKASYCFKMYYKKAPGFPWYMAGYQLAFLKSIAVSQGRGAPPVLVTPEMYASVRPDAKFVRAVAALHDGRRYLQGIEETEGAEYFSDQDE